MGLCRHGSQVGKHREVIYVVWQPPKQDWIAGDVPSSSDFNRIEGNTQDLRDTIDLHIDDKENPHGVTKSQVGLGNLLNYAVATMAQAEEGTSNAAYMTPLRTMQSIAAWFERNVGGIVTIGTFEDSLTVNPRDYGYIDVYYPSGAKCNIGGIAILAPPSRVTPLYTGAIAIAKARSVMSLIMFHHVCYDFSDEGPQGYVLVSPVVTEHGGIGSNVLQRQWTGQFGVCTFLHYLIFQRNRLEIALKNEHESNAYEASLVGTYLII